MLRASNLSKTYGDLAVLREVSLFIGPGERAGLIGPNGAGKTTLLRLLAGRERPDGGSVFVDPNARLGYLEQGLTFDPQATLGAVLRDPREDVIAQIEGYAAAVAADIAVIDDYQRALDKLDAMGGYPNDAVRAEVLAQLGLAGLPLDMPVAHLSGGQKTRLGLARILLSEPNVLILDEPTNHLDVAMLEWLENWLARFAGAALIVSHDRVFLDRAVNRIFELNGVERQIKAYAGNYSDYLAAKSLERQKQQQAFEEQRAEIARLSAAAAHMRGIAKFKVGGKADGGDKFAKGFFANRGKETVAKAKRIEARVEKLLTEDRIDRPRLSWQMKVDFQSSEGSQDVLVLDDLTVGYGDRDEAVRAGQVGGWDAARRSPRVLLADVSLHIRRGERVALLGENGIGKSTLLKTIAGVIPPLGGSFKLGPSVRLGYFAQEQENLDPARTPLDSLRYVAPMSETDARSFLHYFLFTGDQPLNLNSTLSFGERARLMLALLVAQGCNFLLLDEPINHLDLPARAQFEQALASFDGTALAVVHDRYFVQGFATRVLFADDGVVREA
jgi:ATP-binding cassette, subfamily F, member 3